MVVENWPIKVHVRRRAAEALAGLDVAGVACWSRRARAIAAAALARAAREDTDAYVQVKASEFLAEGVAAADAEAHEAALEHLLSEAAAAAEAPTKEGPAAAAEADGAAAEPGDGCGGGDGVAPPPAPAGAEVTTGPLGMGVSNAVGLACAERHLASVYNKPGMDLIDHYTYCIMGDGCCQDPEGISHESCAYAGHLGLGKLIVFYDDNGITIDGHTELSFTEDVGKRYEAYGWQVLTVEDGNTDVDGIRKAIAAAKACADKPTLIKVKTVIGYGSPNKADSHDAHGAPLGADEATATREQLGWKYGEFEIPDSVYDVFSAHASEGARKQEEWNKVWAQYQEKEPELAKQFQRVVLDKTLPEGWADCLPKVTPEDKGKATRLWSQDCLNALASTMPDLIGGSADLAPSNMTLMKCTGDFLKGSYEGRNMRFGIREFGMGAVANAVSLHKTGLVPYCATFTIFSDYMRNAIRLAALAQAGTIFVTTHDSIAVGEDGPTHQPIETVPSLRMIPDLTVIRPADGNECSGAYKVAFEKSKLESMPTFLALTRQALPNLPNSSIENVEKGAYAVIECADPDLVMVATGSEVSLCVDACKELTAMGKKIRVVSMPSWELFRAQPASYKDSILPKGVATLSVEAAVTMGWEESGPTPTSASTASAPPRQGTPASTSLASASRTSCTAPCAASRATRACSRTAARASTELSPLLQGFSPRQGTPATHSSTSGPAVGRSWAHRSARTPPRSWSGGRAAALLGREPGLARTGMSEDIELCAGWCRGTSQRTLYHAPPG
ncbi:unnamed protein product [Prorocentrum cordatum]|uniref:Transketolase-like pyrimidine-binding domain-containing protein n=1 Tax=Prorocentrum cordatum TaxID=2364126 RepID=A0ABN9US30_9DINO|nr:unnamed protein product [Polarella glacialis]